ncbi:MAG TPA: PHP domain-containing protein [Candidatus Bathyarchaeia archaeon]|nr:PHP domain-containing protein [Candidatus Bathyarchaeia archaeon]
MAILKGNLHAHTTFSDGRFPVEEVISRYRDLGYDFLAITDHDDLIEPDYWLNIPASDDRMIILPGVELDYKPLSQHVGKVTGDRETLYILNHPARYALTVDQALRRIRRISQEWFPIHAVELSDTGVYRGEYDVEAIELPKIATDDSHHDEHIGRAWIEVSAARNPDAILRSIKAGDFAVGFGLGGIARPAPRTRADETPSRKSS